MRSPATSNKNCYNHRGIIGYLKKHIFYTLLEYLQKGAIHQQVSKIQNRLQIQEAYKKTLGH